MFPVSMDKRSGRFDYPRGRRGGWGGGGGVITAGIIKYMPHPNPKNEKNPIYPDLVQNVKAIKQETNWLDQLIFKIVGKMFISSISNTLNLTRFSFGFYVILLLLINILTL